MLAKARLATIFPILVVLVLFLQGCSVSGGDSDDEAPASAAAPRVELATTTGTAFLIADGASSVPIQVTVTNAAGQGLANMTVTFSTTAGSLAVPAVVAALRANGSTEAVTTTNANGVAQVTLTASNTIETATVSARVDTGGGTSVAPAPLTINFISGAPAGIELRAIPATVGVGTTSTILATVTDAGGVPIAGVTVTFSGRDGTMAGPSALRDPSPAAVTDRNGIRSLDYRSTEIDLLLTTVSRGEYVIALSATGEQGAVRSLIPIRIVR